MNLHCRNNVVKGGSYLQINYGGNVTVDSDYNLIYGYTPDSPGPVTRGWTVLSELFRGRLGKRCTARIRTRLSTRTPARCVRRPRRVPDHRAGADLSAQFTTDYDGLLRNSPWAIRAFRGVGGGVFPPAPRALHNLGTRAFSLGLF